MSWLWRLADRYGLSAAATLVALGIPRTAASVPTLEEHLRGHSATLTERLGPHHPFGSQRPPAQSPVLDAELGRYARTYRTGRIPSPTFRYCPDCLTEAGTWSRSWLTRLPGTCPTHKVVLLTCCPSCGAAPFSKPSWLTVTSPPWVCPLTSGQQPEPRRHRHRCGQDLREAPTHQPSVDQTHCLSVLHDLATAAATTPQSTITVTGIVTTRRDHLDAVFELVDELVGVKTVLAAEPDVSGGFLAATRVALSVLKQPSADQAAGTAEQHGLLNPAGRHTPLLTDSRLRRRPHNPLLAAIRLQSLGTSLSPTAQLTFRTASAVPGYPAPYPPGEMQDYPTSWPGQTRLDWIPQVIWPGVLAPWIDDGDIPARAAASMLLAKVGSTRSWSLIALDLGIPAAFATTPPALIKRMRRAGLWEHFLRALDELATRLEDHPPPINYSARRWASCTPRHMHAAIKQARLIYGGCDISDDSYLARMTWALYTGGHGPFFPGTDISSPGVEETEPHPLGDRITRFTAETLHHLAGQPDDGPLTWRPP